MKKIAILISVMATLLVAGCAGVPAPADKDEIAALASAIHALGPDVDPAEAARAAQIAYSYPLALADRYEITDPPLVHNTKVNMGLKPRGLCWHWADDMEARLNQEDFHTLVVQRAIATPEFIGIQHSTALISLPGATIYDGIVLDPWRYGGALFWSPTRADTRYNWRPRREVMDEMRRQRAGRRVAVGG